MNLNSDMPGNDGFQALSVTAAAFLLGAVIGSIAAAGIDNVTAVSERLQGFLSGGGEISFLDALEGMLKYGLLLWLFSFMSIGLIFAPLVIMFRCFVLSFTVTSFVKLMGIKGMALAAASFGLQNLFALPALFVLAAEAFVLSRRLFSLSVGQGSRGLFPLHDREFFSISAFCFILLLIAAVLEAYICPLLTSLFS